MARPRRAVIRAAVAQNRPAKPRLSVSQNRPANRNIGVSRGRPARPSAGYGGQGRGDPQVGARSGAQASAGGLSAMPWDSQATNTSASGQRTYSDTIAGIGAERDFKLREYGLNPGYENNPYSQASLLQRQREIGIRGINQRPGQLYSGATINHLGQTERGYNEGSYRLKTAQEQDVARWEREELRATHEKEEADEEAQQRAIERAEEQAPEPAPLGGGGGGGKRKKGGGGAPKRGKGIRG